MAEISPTGGGPRDNTEWSLGEIIVWFEDLDSQLSSAISFFIETGRYSWANWPFMDGYELGIAHATQQIERFYRIADRRRLLRIK